ncbi:DUF3090 domain-containing protein [Corynebacterium provencense]|uniref:DUF3090 domain-containing protein n=1 Tax=Corynebacterium provencense TaxID=1737425 RepID=UPI0008334F04|nr:DUF3090 domain-containing protein [Corynebacterium provencense]
MSTITHGFDWPDRFVVGTVGLPGDRTFYLQARDRDRTVSVALEKQQSAALAEGVSELLAKLRQLEGNPVSVPDETPDLLVDDDPLDLPLDEEFRVGVLTLGWDPGTSQVVIEAAPAPEVEVEDLDDLRDIGSLSDIEPEQLLVVRIPVGAARAFVDRTFAVVRAGRPECPICHEPMDDPETHVCDLSDR